MRDNVLSRRKKRYITIVECTHEGTTSSERIPSACLLFTQTIRFPLLI